MSSPDSTPAELPAESELVPCAWNICDFAFPRDGERWDVVIFDICAMPLELDGTCMACGSAAIGDSALAQVFIKTKLGTDYRLAPEPGNPREYITRLAQIQEDERKAREIVTRSDQRGDILQLEVAGTVIALTQREAALVVYTPEAWSGKKIEVTDSRRGRMWAPRFKLTATVIGRTVGPRTVYAAIFPRIQPLSYVGLSEGVRSARVEIIASHESEPPFAEVLDDSGQLRRYYRGVCWYRGREEVFLGNVTEVDWTRKQPRDWTRERDWARE